MSTLCFLHVSIVFCNFHNVSDDDPTRLCLNDILHHYGKNTTFKQDPKNDNDVKIPTRVCDMAFGSFLHLGFLRLSLVSA